MTNYSDNANMTEVTVTDPIVAQQNDLIAQLMRQIDDMKKEMRKTQGSTNMTITANLPVQDDERPSLFPQAPPSLQNPNVIQANMDPYNPPAMQILPPKIPCHMPIFTNPRNPRATYSDIDHYEEREKEWKAKEDRARLNIKEEIAKAMKQFHFATDVTGLDYESLCIHPDLSLPEGFKIPKFDTFNGSGNPLAHLRAYCDQLVGVGKNKALLMRLFSRSLSGEALEWYTSQEINRWTSWNTMAKDFVERFAYNVEIVPDRYSLKKIRRRSTESYREYAYRWRKNAARVHPPMSEKEIIEVFVRSQEPEFYERMMLLVGAKFADIVKVGENIEDDLKTGRIGRISTSTGTSGMIRKREEEVSVVSGRQNKRNKYPDCNQASSASQSHSKVGRKPPRVFTPLAESQTKLFERLSAAGLIQPIPPKAEQINSHFVEGDQTCAYHSNHVGHDTEDCISLKHKIQDLIDSDAITLRTVAPNVNKNPLPEHGENATS